MDLGLTNRVAAVAAASSGLGRAAATALALEGAQVAICSRDETRVREAAAAIEAAVRDAGGVRPRVLAVAMDLASPSGPAKFIEETERAFGRVDVVVANNGGPPPGPAVAVNEEQWRAGFDLTFLSSVRLAQAALAGMRQRRWGRILFITSVSVKQPIENLAISTALRSGVAGYAKALADEVAADGVTVNTVAPGSTRTARLEQLLEGRAQREGISRAEAESRTASQNPMRRIGRPEEFAAAVAFLASECASFITGIVLPIDGGQCRAIT